MWHRAAGTFNMLRVLQAAICLARAGAFLGQNYILDGYKGL